jgi:hypothetical protein
MPNSLPIKTSGGESNRQRSMIMLRKKLGPPIRPRMALTYYSQFLADIGLTEAMSSSSLQLSSQSKSRCPESFTSYSLNELSVLDQDTRCRESVCQQTSATGMPSAPCFRMNAFSLP